MPHVLQELGPRLVIAHRGNSAHVPENTLEAFRQGVALGVDALEFDVRLSADGHVVVMHDPTVDRTTSGSGDVATMPLAEMRALDAGARFTRDHSRSFPWAGKGVRVPTLDEVLEEFPTLPLLIEIKTATASVETRRRIEAHRAESRCMVASFDEQAIIPFRNSRIPIGASLASARALYLSALFRLRPPSCPFQALSIPPVYRGLPLPVAGYVRALSPLGIPVHVWTIDDPRQAMRFWQMGVRGILSNDPGLLIGLRDRE